MKKKFLLTGIVIVATALMFCGCGNSKKASEKTTAAKTETTPSVDYSNGFDENGYVKGVKAEDIVTLCDYKKIVVNKKDIVASDEEVDSNITKILANYPEVKQVKDRKAKEGDTVNLAYKGTCDGKDIENGSDDNADLTLGSNSFIPGFEDQIVGHKPGETFDINVTFPKDYNEKTLQGKKAVFKITLHYIKEQKDPKLTDEFVKKNLKEQYGYTSVKDMKKKIRESIQENNKAQYVWKNLVDKSTYKDIPKATVDMFVDTSLQSIVYNANSYNYKEEDIPSLYGCKTMDDLKAKLYTQCETAIKGYLCAQLVAQGQKLDVSVDDYFKDQGQDPSSYISFYGEPYMKSYVIQNQVVQYLMDNSTVK